MTFSIRQKIIFFSVIPVTLIYNIILLVSLYQNIGSESRYVQNRLADTVAANASQLNSNLRDAVLLAENASSLLMTFSGFDSQERLGVSRALLSTSDSLSGMGVVKSSGDGGYQLGIVWKESRNWVQYPNVDMLPGLSHWLKEWLKGGELEGWSPLLDFNGKGMDFGYVYASRYQTDDANGASLVFLPIDIVKREWVAPSGVQPLLMLLNASGDAIYSSRNLNQTSEQLNNSDSARAYVRSILAEMDKAGTPLLEFKFDNTDVLVFKQEIESVGWTLLGAIPKGVVNSVVRSKVMVQAWIMLLSLIGIFISCWFAAGRIVRPLRLLDRAMARVAAGDLNTRINLSGDDEASRLAKRFTVMTQELMLREKREWQSRTTSFDHIVQAMSGEFFYFSHDVDGMVNYVSPSINSILGIPVDKFRSHYTRYYTQSALNERGKQVTRNVLNGASSGMYEVEMHDDHGNIHYVEIVKVPVFDRDRRVTGIEGMGRNVTSRVNDTVRFRGLLESAPDAMVITDSDGVITMVNARTEALLGFLRASLIGCKVSCLFPENEIKRFPLLSLPPEERVKLRIRSGFEIRIRKRSGQTIPVEITLNPIETPDGVLISIFMRDVSDRHAAEHALRSSEERYRRMIEALQQEYIFYTQRVDGSYMFMTDSVERILGYSAKDFISNGTHYLRSDADRQRVQKVHAQVRQGKPHPSYELEVIKADGSIGVIEVLDTPAFNDKGQVTVIEGIVRDRTKERNAATALAEARDAAEAANEAKTLFLSNMSHELRTPLNGVLGYTQLLMGELDVTLEQYGRLVAIQTCGQHLLTLINDILDLTKAESGEIYVESKPVHIPALVDTVEQILYQKAESSALDLELTVAQNVPAVVLGDETKLRQILINLVSNAIKYTDKGQVRLTVTDNDQQLVFTVEDTGIGIAEEHLDKIFDPFRQEEGGRREGGTGLGLSISRRLASAMKGSLRVTSELGKGSCFVFTMPLRQAEQSSGPVKTQDMRLDDAYLASGQQVKVLVVDDNRENREILVEMLEATGFIVTAVDNGRAAVDAVKHEVMDLVLMDLRMPGVSGFRATRMLYSQLKSVPPVIAISAGIYPNVLEDLRHWGFVDFIGKPFRSKELFRVIRRHLNLLWKECSTREHEKPKGGQQENTFHLPAHIVTSFSEAVDMGDVEAVRLVALEVQNDSSATLQGGKLWSEKVLACCDTLDFEELEHIVGQLKAIS